MRELQPSASVHRAIHTPVVQIVGHYREDISLRLTFLLFLNNQEMTRDEEDVSFEL